MFLQPYNLLPDAPVLAELLAHTLDPMVHLESTPDKDTRIVFDEMQAFHTVEIDLDPRTRMLVIDAESTDGTLATTRAVKLPFGVTHPEQITAELTGGKVIITVPQAAREPELAAQPAEPSPTREAKAKRLKVHVAPTSAGELHVKHSDGKLNITLAGMGKKGVTVDLVGKVLQIRGPVAEGSARINRRFKLHSKVVKPNDITASLEPDGTLNIVVPDDAIEHHKGRTGPLPSEKIEVKPSPAA